MKPKLSMMRRLSRVTLSLAIVSTYAALVSGCNAWIPTIGPSRSAIEAKKPRTKVRNIEVVDIDDVVTRQLLDQRAQHLFSETLGEKRIKSRLIGAGDSLEVSIWEAAPATLFGSGLLAPTAGIATSHPTTLPEQMVDDQGTIYVPFAGRITAAGKTLDEIEAEIVAHLNKKANQPEVLVRLTRNMSSNVTVVGEVNTSTRVPLLPGNERLLDILAAAAGVRQPVNKMTIQITRADNVYALPLETIIRDPRQNVPLQPGDVITALFQPYSFTALGATGKNEEVSFETQGITLAQALARSGGLIDSRSNVRGVFIFRFEPKDALVWPQEPLMTTADGRVATVFRIDLSDPESFFLIQNFWMENKDILYVSNAPITEIQKALNVLFSVAYPVLAVKQVGF
jgi:polysaccharide export outer membrane protein